MAKKQKEQPVLTLDGEEYFAGDMTDEQLRIKDHLADLQRKLDQSTFNVRQMQGGLEHFESKLDESLKSKDG